MTNILNVIDKTIKELWKSDIYNDLIEEFLLKEDSLKNALYYHLRNQLTDMFLIKHNVRIFTEYDLDKNYRADIAIVKLKSGEEMGDEYLIKDRVDSILAIIEIKYKDNKTSIQPFCDDINKVRKYIESGMFQGCQFYLAFICENENIQKDLWIENQEHWITNNLTILDIMYSNETGYFEPRIETYNRL